MESEVCFEQTKMRGQTVKQRNGEGQTRKPTNKGGGTDKRIIFQTPTEKINALTH